MDEESVWGNRGCEHIFLLRIEELDHEEAKFVNGDLVTLYLSRKVFDAGGRPSAIEIHVPVGAAPVFEED